jgi:hypothetical protein
MVHCRALKFRTAVAALIVLAVRNASAKVEGSRRSGDPQWLQRTIRRRHRFFNLGIGHASDRMCNVVCSGPRVTRMTPSILIKKVIVN